MPRISALFLVIAIAVVATACKSELAGDVTIDGKKFVASDCRSGEAFGFAGVAFMNDEGTRLRLVQTPTNEASVVLIPAGKSTGIEIGKCGQFVLRKQNSTINNITNVMGEAKLSCSAHGHTIKGTIEFKNCH
jgi:hypothetical protein